MKKLKFRPGELNYRRHDTIDSPFLKRSQVSFPTDAKTKAKLRVVQETYYQLFFANEKEAYLSRNQSPTPTADDQQPIKIGPFQFEDNLPGNLRQIRFSLDKLIRNILIRFEENPQSLFDEAEKIRAVCEEVGFPVPILDAFNQISSWEAFMDLLRSLAGKQTAFRFELLIAAITQYADRCAGK